MPVRPIWLFVMAFWFFLYALFSLTSVTTVFNEAVILGIVAFLVVIAVAYGAWKGA